MTTRRPVFLEPWRIRLPIGGLVSILHRVSGVLLVLAIPYATYLLGLSLRDAAGFAAASAQLDHLLVRLVLLVLAWSFVHHLLAGLRFLLLDLGVGLDRACARKSAFGVLWAALALVIVGAGIWL